MNQDQLVELLRRAENSTDVHQGGNSKVRHVRFAEADYAVKDYSAREDGHSRQRRESAALAMLHPCLPAIFAEPIGVSADGLRAVHSWLHGVRPEANRETIFGMLGLLNSLHALSNATGIDNAPPATDQILSGGQFQGQINGRVAALLLGPSEVHDVTKNELIPAVRRLERTNSSDPARPVLTLSPSDFGVHNLLWNAAGRTLHCVDLEFFGWDDAHKLVCDSLLHPLAQWDEGTAEAFLEGATCLYGLDNDRLLWLWPRLCIKWATITLAKASREYSTGDRTLAGNALKRAKRFVSQGESVEFHPRGIVQQIAGNQWKGFA